MKRHRMPDIKEGGVNVTPLIDIVMCLIIFFMLVAKIGVSTGAEKMAIPETIQGKRIDDMGNTLTLNVRSGAGDEPFVTALVDGQPLPTGAVGEPGIEVDAVAGGRAFGDAEEEPGI